jgi:hypothetical protein
LDLFIRSIIDEENGIITIIQAVDKTVFVADGEAK